MILGKILPVGGGGFKKQSGKFQYVFSDNLYGSGYYRCLVSTDYGATWNVSNAPQPTFPAVWSSDGSLLFAGASRTWIYVSTDQGATFTLRNLNVLYTSGTVDKFDCSETGQYVAMATSAGQVIYSTDFGVTWARVLAAIGNNLKELKMTSDGSFMYTHVYSGYAMYSTNFGASWTGAPTHKYGDYTLGFDLAVNGSNRPFTAVNGNYILVSPDFFTHHITMQPSASVFSDVAMSGNGQFQTVTRESQSLMRSTDFGATWSACNSPIRVWRGVSMDDTGQYQLATSSYGFAVSSDYGANWTEKWSGASFMYPSVAR